MPGQRWKLLLAAIVALGVAAAACSGGSGNGRASTPKPAKATATVNPALQQLRAASAKSDAATYRASYTFSATGADPLNATLTMFRRGADSLRIDVAASQAGQDVALTDIETKDVSVFCFQKAAGLAPLLGLQPDAGVCFKNDASGSGGNVLGDIIGDLRTTTVGGDASVSAVTTRTVAGQPATCYQYTTKGSGDRSETCFGPFGVRVYDKTTNGGDTTTLEATQIQASVQDSDFTVPYAIKAFPAVASTTP
ncbi:MAG: hypothetical protein IVW36_09085 [Dehalococcoidia bacterium]|nr:hypothetical protein [Dehalococcoidia bacterium]